MDNQNNPYGSEGSESDNENGQDWSDERNQGAIRRYRFRVEGNDNEVGENDRRSNIDEQSQGARSRYHICDENYSEQDPEQTTELQPAEEVDEIGIELTEGRDSPWFGSHSTTVTTWTTTNTTSTSDTTSSSSGIPHCCTPSAACCGAVAPLPCPQLRSPIGVFEMDSLRVPAGFEESTAELDALRGNNDENVVIYDRDREQQELEHRLTNPSPPPRPPEEPHPAARYGLIARIRAGFRQDPSKHPEPGPVDMSVDPDVLRDPEDKRKWLEQKQQYRNAMAEEVDLYIYGRPRPRSVSLGPNDFEPAPNAGFAANPYLNVEDGSSRNRSLYLERNNEAANVEESDPRDIQTPPPLRPLTPLEPLSLDTSPAVQEDPYGLEDSRSPNSGSYQSQSSGSVLSGIVASSIPCPGMRPQYFSSSSSEPPQKSSGSKDRESSNSPLSDGENRRAIAEELVFNLEDVQRPSNTSQTEDESGGGNASSRQTEDASRGSSALPDERFGTREMEYNGANALPRRQRTGSSSRMKRYYKVMVKAKKYGYTETEIMKLKYAVSHPSKVKSMGPDFLPEGCTVEEFRSTSESDSTEDEDPTLKED